jgi:hypothetical protein
LTDLADKLTQLESARADLAKAQAMVSYSHGDTTVERLRILELAKHVSRLAREYRELAAAANGATNPLAITPTWT